MGDFLRSGSKDHSPWMIFFKIPQCQHCKQAKMMFDTLSVEHQRRLSEQKEANFNYRRVEPNLRLASIDWYPTKNTASRVQASVPSSMSSDTPLSWWSKRTEKFASTKQAQCPTQ